MERKSDLFIIEVLRPEDYARFGADGLHLVGQMQAMGFESHYARVYTFDDFKNAINRFKDFGFKWLHISCHGCENGIAFYDEEEWKHGRYKEVVVSNHDFASALSKKTSLSRITISGCQLGNENFLKEMFVCNPGIHSIVAPIDSLQFIIAGPLWSAFYSLLMLDSDADGEDVKVTGRAVESAVQRVSECFRIKLAFNEYHPEKSASNPKPSVSRKVSGYTGWIEENDKFMEF